MKLKHLYQTVYKVIPAILIIFIIQTTIIPMQIFAAQKDLFLADSQDEFDKKFREGRDLMDKEDWTNAAKIFLEITNKYPTNKSADAALYWLAFCYKKTGKFNEAVVILDRLLKDFPKSSWESDARVLQLELKKLIGEYEAMSKSYAEMSGSFEKLAKSYQELSESLEKTKKNLPVPPTFPNFDGSLDSPLEREDEMKLAAFQGLLAADPKRAIEMVGDLLKPDSKASDSLKRNVLRSLRNPKFQTRNSTTKNNEFVSQLRETLVKSYQNESKNNIKAEIIYALVNLNDGEANNYLLRVYSAEKDKEFKKAIIKSFNGLNFFSPEAAANLTVSSPAKFDKLWEIFRTEKDNELRILTLSNLRRFTNWSAKTEVLETLFQVYAAEKDEAFKLEIIRSLAATKENQALNKLMQIAKNDGDQKMRLEAIRLLQTIKTPEVIKFLEDLAK